MQVLNFSIAYGKTAHGLSRDWGTSLNEAQETVERWYADRPEVRPLTLQVDSTLCRGDCLHINRTLCVRLSSMTCCWPAAAIMVEFIVHVGPV